MLTLYPVRQKHKGSSAVENLPSFPLADAGVLFAGVIALLLVLLPLRADCGFHSSNTKFGKLPVHKKIVRKGAVRGNDAFSNVLVHLRSYRKAIRNTRYLTIIDYSKPSNVKRMYLIDIKTGRVEKFLVSHGKNSGWAYATAFSNRPNPSRVAVDSSSRAENIPESTEPHSNFMGFKKGSTTMPRRGIVMHGANYVCARSVRLNGGRLGEAWGVRPSRSKWRNR